MHNGEGVEGGQLHDEGLLDALQDGQEEEDRVEAGQEDLEMNLVDIVFHRSLIYSKLFKNRGQFCS